MKRLVNLGLGSLALLGLLALATPASALAIMAPPAIPMRVAHADLIVVGKVTKIEDKTVSATTFPGAKDKAEYQIAVVKVDDPILNAKGIKEVRVGFVPAPAGGIRPGIRPGFRPVSLTEDEEGCLFLTKHHEGDFYIMPAYFDAVKKANNTNYEKEVEETKKAAKLIADPMTTLKSKDADERFQTAAMLIERYRTVKQPTPNVPKQEPIDAAESKLILEALRDADWTPPKPMPGRFITMTPLNSFFRLQLTKEDKWTPPTDGKFAEAAQSWLKDNADTYRIKKFVADTKDEKKDK
jgi:hypothetical protein